MTASVTRHPNADLRETWPGHVDLNREGVRLALAMFSDMYADNEASCIENWARDGVPFSNFVADYLRRATEAGPDVLEAFCAILTDCAGMVAQGECIRDVRDYAEWYVSVRQSHLPEDGRQGQA